MTRAILLCLAIAACHAPRAEEPTVTDPAAEITQIDLEVQRAPGMAFVTYHADGRIEGGHMSGDDPPFVHQATGTLAPADREALWTAAAAAAAVPPSGADLTGDTLTLTVTRADATTVAWRWLFGGAPDAPAVKALSDLVHEHHVGGW